MTFRREGEGEGQKEEEEKKKAFGGKARLGEKNKKYSGCDFV